VAPRRKGRRVPGTAAVQRFTKAELDALSVYDDVVLKLTDDLAADVSEGDRGLRSVLPHWSVHDAAQEEGAAIAVWQVFAPPPGVDAKLPSWLRKQGISWFRGWIRHAGAAGPDFVMDWVIDINNETYETAPDGDAGPYSPPPGCDLQTFVNAVAHLSRDFLLDELTRKMNMLVDAGKLQGERVRSPLDHPKWQAWKDLTLEEHEPRAWFHLLEQMRGQLQPSEPDLPS
jgi:hypothetical protein